jgi:hypothetical protein
VPSHIQHQQVFRLLSDDGEESHRLSEAGNYFLRRFWRSGDLMDIDKAISHHEHAVHLTPDGHADMPGRLNNLGNSFARRFQRSGDLMDIDKAISHHEHAVHLTPDDHADKPAHLNNLGNSFLDFVRRSKRERPWPSPVKALFAECVRALGKYAVGFSLRQV